MDSWEEALEVKDSWEIEESEKVGIEPTPRQLGLTLATI